MPRAPADELGPVFRALADDTRRVILDALASGPRTTTELVEAVGEVFPELSRFAVLKHLEVLRAVDLVQTRAEGARRINTINAVPLHRVYARWVSRYAAVWAGVMVDVGREAEGKR